MNCRRARKLVFDFVDGLSDETLKLDLERHLGECEACADLASSLTRSLDLIHRVPEEPVDENFTWKVRLAIHKERQMLQEQVAEPARLFRAWNLRYAASAVAGLAVVVTAGWLAISTGVAPNKPAFNRVTDQLAERPASTISDRPTYGTNPLNRTVSGGAGFATSTPLQGAIDAPAAIDSLVNEAMRRMTEEERIRYLEEHIHVLQSHLDKCKARKQDTDR